jgi:hypothetical protein
VGKPNERDLFISFRKVISAAKYNFQQGKTSLTTPNSPHKFCLEFCAKSVLLYGPLYCTAPRKLCPQSTVQTEQYDPFCSKEYSNSLEFCASKMPRKTCPSSLLYGLYGSVQYGLQQQRTQQLHTENLLGKCAQSPLGNAPACYPFLFKLSLSQSLSIFFFTCLAHYPRHSLII